MNWLRRLAAWWAARPCRVCGGSGVDEGFALGAHYSISCCFCAAGDERDRRVLTGALATRHDFGPESAPENENARVYRALRWGG